MTNYSTIQEAFEILDQAGVQYLVLRNYDNLLSPEMYMDGHGDVDLLVADSQQVARLLGAETNRKNQGSLLGDGTHYFINVGGKRVSLDLRHIGDGYYCNEWEQALLDRRVRHQCFWVMAPQDYFYTLVYHAILQKRRLSDEYRGRLLAMARGLGLDADGSERRFIELLQDHMRGSNYYFVYPKDPTVPARFSLVDGRLVRREWGAYWPHLVFQTRVRAIEMLVALKHFIFKRSR